MKCGRSRTLILYKSVCSVTVSIGEMSLSLLERLEAWECEQQGYCIPIKQSVNQVLFPVQLGWWKQSISTAKRRHLAAERPHPSPLGAKVTLKVPQRVRTKRPEVKRFLVHFELKIKPLATMVLNKISPSTSLRVLIPSYFSCLPSLHLAH